MSNTFFISDLHIGHTNILKFKSSHDDTKLLRPGFAHIDEHDDFVIDSINSVVKPTDRLVVVGDCVMNKKLMHKMLRINGIKTLVMGNHDPVDPEYLTPYFEKIAGAMYYDEFIVTHIPVHEYQVKYRFKGNIHGHLHDGVVTTRFDTVDTRYFNVAVERLNYVPIAYEELKKKF